MLAARYSTDQFLLALDDLEHTLTQKRALEPTLQVTPARPPATKYREVGGRTVPTRD